MVFRTEWFNEAREEVVNNTKAIEVLLRSQQDPLEFNIVVPQETTEEEMKNIAHAFLKKLTESSGKSMEETIWNSFSYIVHIENSIDGYYDTGVSYVTTTNDSSPINQWGYPEIMWMDGLKSP
ncbi:hypothetical protein ABEW00_01280 [Rossellomorea vietnamensis]|uniref:hypothetical protein n=1 Tax=Rossellomorea vietnamensis TaxID=218284 RepID=UPI003D285246